MPVINTKFLVHTNGNSDIVDLTYKIKLIISEFDIKNALVSVHSPCSSTGIGVMEYNPDIIRDFSDLISKFIPYDINYKHNAEWNDNLADTYLKSLFVGCSVSIPFVEGSFELDRFQRILLFDFNSLSATRSVIIQIIY